MTKRKSDDGLMPLARQEVLSEPTRPKVKVHLDKMSTEQFVRILERFGGTRRDDRAQPGNPKKPE